MTRRLLVAALLACSGSCSGGTAGGNASYTKLDDMEAAGPYLPWASPPGTTPGFWWAAVDCTQAERIEPPPYFADPNGWSYSAFPTARETFPGIVSTQAARLRTTMPLVAIWGASMGFDFAQVRGDGGQPRVPGSMDAGAPAAGEPCRPGTTTDFPGVAADLTAYSGITFWAMAVGSRKLLVQVNDVNTDPRGGICQDVDSAAADYCYNGFGTQLVLTDTLTRYTIEFSRLAQRPGWGYRPASGVIDLQRVYGMNFEMDLPSCPASGTTMCAGGTPSLSFDLWIDDLYFVNK